MTAANDAQHLGSALVTGGTGFLGRHIVERLLAQGRPVTVLARQANPDMQARGVRFITTPLENTAAVRKACAGMSTVFHVAAKVGVWGPYEDFFQANVLGTRALLEGCRDHGVTRFVHTSTPSVVYNGKDIAGADESLPLTTRCPSPYPLTKALAEQEVLGANSERLRTVALRPHLIWGVGDPHLVPRILARARAKRLRIVGPGTNRVDMVHVDNAADAHLLAERALAEPASVASGKAYFITNDEPVLLWGWINDLLTALGNPPVTKHIPLPLAKAVGAGCEGVWKIAGIRGEPPMTRFVAAELAKNHWFNITAAKRELGYYPRRSMREGFAELMLSLKQTCRA